MDDATRLEYTVYFPPAGGVGGDEEEEAASTAARVLPAVTGAVAAATEGYMWEQAPFNVAVARVVPRRKASTAVAAAAAAAGGVSPWGLAGVTDVGSSSVDEWFVVWLASMVSTVVAGGGGVVAVVATAGGQEFDPLVVEAAEELPPWFDADDARGRSFLVNGALHLIPGRAGRGAPAGAVPPSPLADAAAGAAWVRAHPTATRAGDGVQAALRARLGAYPAAARAQRHVAVATLPRAAAAVLASAPALITHLAQRFYERDADDVAAAARMRAFPLQSAATDCVTVRVRMTRTAYAKLRLQRYLPPRGYAAALEPHVRAALEEAYRSVPDATWPPPSAGVLAVDLGAKIVAAMEMMLASAPGAGHFWTALACARQAGSSTRGVGADAAAGGSTPATAAATRAAQFDAFVASLQSRGFFASCRTAADRADKMTAARAYFERQHGGSAPSPSGSGGGGGGGGGAVGGKEAGGGSGDAAPSHPGVLLAHCILSHPAFYSVPPAPAFPGVPLSSTEEAADGDGWLAGSEGGGEGGGGAASVVERLLQAAEGAMRGGEGEPRPPAATVVPAPAAAADGTAPDSDVAQLERLVTAMASFVSRQSSYAGVSSSGGGAVEVDARSDSGDSDNDSGDSDDDTAGAPSATAGVGGNKQWFARLAANLPAGVPLTEADLVSLLAAAGSGEAAPVTAIVDGDGDGGGGDGGDDDGSMWNTSSDGGSVAGRDDEDEAAAGGMAAAMAAMDAALAGEAGMAGGFDRLPATYTPAAEVADGSAVMAGGMSEADVRVNLLAHMSRSVAAQGGRSGPTSNVLGELGVDVPPEWWRAGAPVTTAAADADEET